MALPRQKFRELVFQMLFAVDFSLENKGLDTALMSLLKTTRAQVKKAESEAGLIIAEKTFLDGLIKDNSTEYRLERISKVELNILRLALFELFFRKEIPAKVSITESVRMARKFGSEKGSQFVNAILDNVYQKHKAEFLEKDQK